MTNQEDSTALPVHERGIDGIAAILAAHDPVTHHSDNASRIAAVAMILRENAQGRIETLFIQRATDPRDPWSGHMAFPGGHRDPGDATLEEVACRETREEVGLDLRPEMKIGRLDDVNGSHPRPYELTVSPFVFHYPEEAKLILSDEVASAVWVPLSFMADPGNVRPYPNPRDPQRQPLPSYQYEGYTIWGMTYRMARSFFTILGVDLPSEEVPMEKP